jgi:hypothetical protein
VRRTNGNARTRFGGATTAWRARGLAFANSLLELPLLKNLALSEKLLMRIRSLKWHAATTASSSHRASARVGAAAVVVLLDAMELAALDVRTAADLAAGELQVDTLGDRLTVLGPQ